jgi:hypothetical protein
VTEKHNLLGRISALEEDLEVWKLIARRYIKSFLFELDPVYEPTDEQIEKELDIAWQEIVKGLTEEEVNMFWDQEASIEQPEEPSIEKPPVYPYTSKTLIYPYRFKTGELVREPEFPYAHRITITLSGKADANKYLDHILSLCPCHKDENAHCDIEAMSLNTFKTQQDFDASF